jgi:hypothetical protein
MICVPADILRAILMQKISLNHLDYVRTNQEDIMNWANVIYHRTRISDSRSIYFFFTKDGYWLLDKHSPEEKASDSSVPIHFEELGGFVDAISKFRATGEIQSFARDFGEFDKRLTVITSEKILNKNGLGIRLDDDDKLWLMDVIHEILKTASSSK